MIQEDQNQMCSNTSSGGDSGAMGDGGGGHGGGGGGDGGGGITTRSSSSSSRKLKQRKVPQRGLGVAQLEKIRMEEQQKKDTNDKFPSSSSSSSKIVISNNDNNKINNNNYSSSSLPINVPLPNYPHTNTNNNNSKSPNSSVSYNLPSPSPPPMAMNVAPPNPIFKTRSLPNTENFNLSSVPSFNGSNCDGFEVGWPSIPVHRNVSFPNLWHPSLHEFSPDHKGENLVFPPSLSFPYETCNVVPKSNAQTQQESCSNSLVNVQGINLSSSSVLSFPMEPPSSQSFLSNYSPFWPDKEKMMVGMKRSCPFSLDNPPIPTFYGKFAHYPLNGTDETTSGRIGGTTYNWNSNNPIFRDIPSCPSTIMHEPTNLSRKINAKENGNSQNGEFLSLGPPTLTSAIANSRVKVSGLEDPIVDRRHGGSNQQQKLISFLPPSKLQATTSATPTTNYNSCNGDIGETIDLTLKL